LLRYRFALDKEKKQTAPCALAVAQPPAINLNRNANADLFIFSVAVSRSYPFSPEKGLPGLGWLSVTATPPLVQQKKLLASTAFFASLGVFIVGINSSIATGLCSFF
jgi:hypothetical protein